jgi:predicted dehydrogenase
MLDDCRPDALYICVPPDQHGAIEMAAIARGVNFFVEKPLALDMKTAEAIRDGAAEKGLITCVGFQDRYLDIVRMTREFLADHTVAFVDGSWVGGIPGAYWWPTYATSGGQIVEQNIHHFDLSRYLFGEPKSVYCAARKGLVTREGYDLHDVSCAVITFESGVIADIYTGCYVTRDHPGYKNGLRIHCTDAEVDYQLRNNVTFRTANSTQNFLRVEDHEEAINRAYIDALKAGDQSLVRSPYADACKSLRLTLACNESIFTGKVVEL